MNELHRTAVAGATTGLSRSVDYSNALAEAEFAGDRGRVRALRAAKVGIGPLQEVALRAVAKYEVPASVV
jgi:hypothetical protein